MEVGAEPGSETQGWVRDWDPNSPCPEQDSWLGVLDFFTSPAVRPSYIAQLVARPVAASHEAAAPAATVKPDLSTGLPPFPTSPPILRGKNLTSRSLGMWGCGGGGCHGAVVTHAGHSLGATVYIRETGVRKKAGWTRTQSWERAKGNSPSEQRFIAWDGVNRPKFCLLTLHIPQPASPCTTRS